MLPATAPPLAAAGGPPARAAAVAWPGKDEQYNAPFPATPEISPHSQHVERAIGADVFLGGLGVKRSFPEGVEAAL